MKGPKNPGIPIKLLVLLGAIRNPPLENNGCPELFQSFFDCAILTIPWNL
jgi:hypothetical protein